MSFYLAYQAQCFQIRPDLSKSGQQSLLSKEIWFLWLLSYHQSNVEGRNFLKILPSKPRTGPLTLAFRKSRPTLLPWLGLACVAWLVLAFGLKPSHAHHYAQGKLFSMPNLCIWYIDLKVNSRNYIIRNISQRKQQHPLQIEQQRISMLVIVWTYCLCGKILWKQFTELTSEDKSY
jgi:hypothetical protein